MRWTSFFLVKYDFALSACIKAYILIPCLVILCPLNFPEWFISWFLIVYNTILTIFVYNTIFTRFVYNTILTSFVYTLCFLRLYIFRHLQKATSEKGPKWALEGLMPLQYNVFQFGKKSQFTPILCFPSERLHLSFNPHFHKFIQKSHVPNNQMFLRHCKK